MDPDFSVEPWNKHISESHWNIKESETGDMTEASQMESSQERSRGSSRKLSENTDTICGSKKSPK